MPKKEFLEILRIRKVKNRIRKICKSQLRKVKDQAGEQMQKEATRKDESNTPFPAKLSSEIFCISINLIYLPIHGQSVGKEKLRTLLSPNGILSTN
jgi:hypothetical protein